MSDQVDAICYAPLSGLAGYSLTKDTYDIVEGVQLVRTTGFELSDTQTEWLGNDLSDLQASRWAFKCNYISKSGTHLGEPENNVINTLNYLSLALWIAQPTGAHIKFYLLYHPISGDKTPTTIQHSNAWLSPLDSYAHSELADTDLAHTKLIASTVTKEKDTDSPIGRSLKYMLGALHMWTIYPRYSLVTAALESLFSTDNVEIAHKISERIAFFLRSKPHDRLAIFQNMKKVYTLRSLIVHGVGVKKKSQGEIQSLGTLQEQVAQEALLKILSSPHLISVLNSKITRDEYFTNLIFSIS